MTRLALLALLVPITLASPLAAEAQEFLWDVEVNSCDYRGPNEVNTTGDATTGQHSSAIEFVAPSDGSTHGDVWAVAYRRYSSNILKGWSYISNITDGDAGTVSGSYTGATTPNPSINRAGHTVDCGGGGSCAWFVYSRASDNGICKLNAKYVSGAVTWSSPVCGSAAPYTGFEPAGDAIRYCSDAGCTSYTEQFLVVWAGTARGQLLGQRFSGNGTALGSYITIYTDYDYNLARPQVVGQRTDLTHGRWMIAAQGGYRDANNIAREGFATFIVDQNGSPSAMVHLIDQCASSANLSCDAMWLASYNTNYTTSQNALHHYYAHYGIDSNWSYISGSLATNPSPYTPVASTEVGSEKFYDVGWTSSFWPLGYKQHSDAGNWATGAGPGVVSSYYATAQGAREGAHSVGTIYTIEDPDYCYHLYLAELHNY